MRASGSTGRLHIAMTHPQPTVTHLQVASEEDIRHID